MTSKFTGKGDRERLAALGDVEAREQQAVAEAQERRAAADADDDVPNTIWVRTEDLERTESHGSVLVFTGHDTDGHVVRFGVDHRPASDLIEEVQANGEVPCLVEDWQVLSRTSAPVV